VVLHLGRVGNLKERMGKRFDLNVVGSGKVMELCLKYGIRRLLVLSTFHIYGAHPHNHTPIYEDEPLRAGTDFPQLGDAVQLDSMATTWVYKHPEVKTIVLRPCNIVGPRIKNAMSRFLRQKRVPKMIGFNPMVQFCHESDMVAAVVVAGEGEAVGVYNVAGRSPIPWGSALELTGADILPVPSSFASFYLKVARRFGSALPAYMVNFTKYPCVIADGKFRTTFDWAPRVREVETIKSTVGR
jgi:UDP-glucose 4-epimerase